MPFYPNKKDQKPATMEPKPPCRDPEHNPPTHMVFQEDGVWVCPSCYAMTMITVPRSHWNSLATQY